MGKKQLLLQGFQVLPIVYAVDLEDGATIEPFGLNPTTLSPDAMATWVSDTWPQNWENLRKEFANSEASRLAAEANDQVAAKRATKVAARKSTAKRATAKKRTT